MPASTEQAPTQQQPFAPTWTQQPPNPADKTARHALGWSLAGFFTCCFPLSLVGLVLGFRARTLSASQKMVVPVASTIAIALSSLALAAFLVFAVWFGMDQAALSERVGELTGRVSAGDANPVLVQETACDLAELRIRTDGWKDDDPIVIDGFDCPGQVEQKDAEAELPDFSFNTSSNGRVTVTVCYKRGARWTVKAFRESGGCLDQPNPAPPQPE
jgi:hypothetical protein